MSVTDHGLETFDGVFVCGAMRSGTTMFRLMLTLTADRQS